jgi:hypothetical protein
MDERQPMDIYDRNAVRLMQHSYRPVPIAPLGLTDENGAPIKKCPVRFNPNDLRFYRLTDWGNSRTITDPQPGANIGVLTGGGVIALDFDHDDAAIIISDALPPSPVNKAGERGFTAFYRADFDVPSEDFVNSNGELVLQISTANRR